MDTYRRVRGTNPAQTPFLELIRRPTATALWRQTKQPCLQSQAAVDPVTALHSRVPLAAAAMRNRHTSLLSPLHKECPTIVIGIPLTYLYLPAADSIRVSTRFAKRTRSPRRPARKARLSISLALESLAFRAGRRGDLVRFAN